MADIKAFFLFFCLILVDYEKNDQMTELYSEAKYLLETMILSTWY